MLPSKAQFSTSVALLLTIAVTSFGQAPPVATGRLLRQFDFEEAETQAVTFPNFFVRQVAEDRGFPRFGRIELTASAASSGRWSLLFDLDGGSLAAGIPTGVIPILPYADYIVTARVRTEGLRHAHALVGAGFANAAGEPIALSRVESDPIRSPSTWQDVTVKLSGQFVEAADLVLDLQVLQPPPNDDPLQPRLEDIAGRVWVDDVMIWHLPRIELSANAPYNVIAGDREPKVSVRVRDLANEALMADLRVIDLAGETLFTTTFSAPRGRQPLDVALPIDLAGWYLVQLDVRGAAGLTGRAELPIVVLPESSGHFVGTNPLAVVLPPHAPPDGATWPSLVRGLGTSEVIASLWDADLTPDNLAERFAVRRAMIEGLLADGAQVTFALDRVPDRLARERGVDPVQVLELMNQPAGAWRSYLDEILVNFGLRVRRWQLGRGVEPDAFWKPELLELVSGAERALAEFIPSPQVVVPFSADQEIPVDGGLEHILVGVPTEIAPSAFADYASPWPRPGRDLTVTFERLDRALYGPYEEVVDLALRTLYAWRQGVDRIAIRAPWRAGPGGIEPDPSYSAWRGLASALSERTFAGELAVGDGIHAWLMAGRNPEDDAIVAWADQPGTRLEMVMANGPVALTDLFGNHRLVTPVDDAHVVELGTMPIFIEEIDLPLARFRAGFGLDPDRFLAKHRVHESAIVLTNPWDIGISGTIRVREPSGVRITPRRHEFVMRPGEEVRLPVSVILDRSIVAGPKPLTADVHIAADRDYRLRVQTGFSVGWPAIDMDASWSVALDAESGSTTLVVTLTITNRGTRPISLDAFLVSPGVGQNRRPISALAPGATAVKAFQIPEGTTLLSRRTVRVGVAERDGLAQLNQLITLPDLSVFSPQSVTTAE